MEKGLDSTTTATILHSMADTGLSDKGKQLVTEAGVMRKDLMVSCEVNEFLKIGKARIQEKLWSQ
jgi:hypothetical protein